MIGNLVSEIGLDAVLKLPMLEKLELTDRRCKKRGLWGQQNFQLQLKSLHLLGFNLRNLGSFKLISMAPKLEDLTLFACELPEQTELLGTLGRNVLKRQDDNVPLKLLVQTPRGGKDLLVTFDEEYLMELKTAKLIL